MHGDARVFFEHSVEIIGMVSQLCGDKGIVDVLVIVLPDVEHYFLNRGRHFGGSCLMLLRNKTENILQYCRGESVGKIGRVIVMKQTILQLFLGFLIVWRSTKSN